jgi:hypothetical protein
MTEPKYGFLYIKLNPEYSHYFKGGFTEHLHKSQYETIYKINKILFNYDVFIIY